MVQIPRQRELQKMVIKAKHPIALFIDEAYDPNGHKLFELRWLMEIVKDGGSQLSGLLAVHPKLSNDLCRLTMEELITLLISLL